MKRKREDAWTALNPAQRTALNTAMSLLEEEAAEPQRCSAGLAVPIRTGAWISASTLFKLRELFLDVVALPLQLEFCLNEAELKDLQLASLKRRSGEEAPLKPDPAPQDQNTRLVMKQMAVNFAIKNARFESRLGSGMTVTGRVEGPMLVSELQSFCKDISALRPAVTCKFEAESVLLHVDI